MSKAIAKELEILWPDFDEDEGDDKLSAFERLKVAASNGDNPQLSDAFTSDRNDFWIRGLLSEPVSDLAGSKCLPELFDALQKNYDEGHDNDRLNHLC